MPKETAVIDTGWKPDHLGAAIYLSILAYPNDPDKRTKFLYAVKAWIIKDMHSGRLPSEKITSSEILKFSKNRDIERQFKKVSEIIVEHRTDAGWKAFFSILCGGKHKNPGIAKLSNGEPFGITKALALQYPQTTSEGGEPYGLNNAMNRTWRPSKKVVHLLHGLQNTKGIPADSEAVKWLIGEPDWLENAIAEAEKYRQSVIRNEFIKKYEENHIQVIYKNSQR